MNLPFNVGDIFSVKEQNFNDLTLEIFQFQAEHNAVYKTYIRHLGVQPKAVKKVDQIPFLPVELYKTNVVKTGSWEHNLNKCFKSSATTQMTRSHHFYNNQLWYETSLVNAFKHFYGPSEEWEILALLPGYLENTHASLIHMVRCLMGESEQFFLDDFEGLHEKLTSMPKDKRKYLLIGVSHALLDFAVQFPDNYSNITIIETGGMKGRKKEITRAELHEFLKNKFNVQNVHSEYGMTELFSQAYSFGDGVFKTPPWMKIVIRGADDPLSLETNHGSGGINVIDLANQESCCFIATSDIGKIAGDGTFEVLGRFDHSEVRGCNVLIR